MANNHGIIQNGHTGPIQKRQEKLPNPPVVPERIKASTHFFHYMGGGVVRLWHREPLGIKWTIIDLPASSLYKFACGQIAGEETKLGFLPLKG